MRLKKKYKIFGLSQKLNRSNSIGNPLIPTKILELNRTKWKRIKDLKKLSVNSLFIDPFSVQHSFDTWTRLNSHRTESYKAKNELEKRFDFAVRNSFFSKVFLNLKSKNKENIFTQILIKPEFRIDILLSRLKFFATSYQVRQHLNSNLILVNNKPVSGNFFLKKGDVITFKKGIFKSPVTDRLLNNEMLFSFVEIDYYSQTLVLLKDYTSLTFEDFSFFLFEKIQLNKLKF